MPADMKIKHLDLFDLTETLRRGLVGLVMILPLDGGEHHRIAVFLYQSWCEMGFISWCVFGLVAIEAYKQR